MLPDVTLPLPASLASLLAVFEPLFTAPSFHIFCGLACGFLAQTGKRTVQKGDRLPSLAELAATTAFTQVTVTRYGKAATISAAAITCLWASVFGTPGRHRRADPRPVSGRL